MGHWDFMDEAHGMPEAPGDPSVDSTMDEPDEGRPGAGPREDRWPFLWLTRDEATKAGIGLWDLPSLHQENRRRLAALYEQHRARMAEKRP